jgi:putative phage-type endonuclease
MQQLTDEWRLARVGKVTASRVADLMARTKTGYSASRANYMAELICERITGIPVEGYTNAAMQWGTDTEPQARASYELENGIDVLQSGLIIHPEIAMLGASPDGLVGEDGLIEIKCPNTATHIETLLSKKVEGKYNTQMQVQMACTGRKWCDFLSFDPRMPAQMQMWSMRVHRDDAYIADIEAEVERFLEELDAKVEILKGEYLGSSA